MDWLSFAIGAAVGAGAMLALALWVLSKLASCVPFLK